MVNKARHPVHIVWPAVLLRYGAATLVDNSVEFKIVAELTLNLNYLGALDGMGRWCTDTA
jgi:hypothetical protein